MVPVPSAASSGVAFGLRWSWTVGLAAALIFLGIDTVGRLDVIQAATGGVVGSGQRPEVDPASPTGFRWGEHRLVLPQVDGYQWLLQAEQELSEGDLRIRSVSYDDAPAGREVHWAGFMRWWSLGVGRFYALIHPNLTPVQALERVAPWANTALLVVLLVVTTPLLAVRLGGLPAALFAFGCVGVQPFFYFFSAGYLDHHGIAAMSAAFVVLLLVLAGAGWVREESEPAGEGGPQERALRDWLPSPDAARRWAVASGLVGALGLWISAAAMAPVLLAIGGGVALAFATGARARPEHASWRFAPEVMRIWGVAGALGSLAFYLLEYFPSHLGMRLEVNHPFYALAFVGGGDLLARFGAAMDLGENGTPAERSAGLRSVVPFLVDATLVLLVPLAILLLGTSSFRLIDRFLWLLHQQSIVEFEPLLAWVKRRSRAQAAADLSLVPLVALPVAAALWPIAAGRVGRLAWRAVLIAVVAASAAYLAVYLGALTRGSIPVALLGTAAVVGIGFGLPLSLRAAELAAPWRGALAVAVVPASLILAASMLQLRWLGNASALWLAVLVVLAAVLIRSRHPQVITRTGGAVSAALTAAVIVVGPAAFLRQPMDPLAADMVMRDAALWLRQRVADDKVVVLASPSTTTPLIWFGGFRGLGTLYWENLDGLRNANSIYSAVDPDSTRARLARFGVTHLAFAGWNAGLALAEAAANEADGSSGRGFLSELEQEMGEGRRFDSLPGWLLPLPYRAPTVSGYPHPVVHLLEVVPDQPPEIVWARLARFYNAVQDREGLDEALTRSLALAPSVPALALKAQVERAEGQETEFRATVAALRTELARDPAVDLADRVDAVFALGLAGDAEGLTAEVSRALAVADEPGLRRLSPDRLSLLVELATRLGLEPRYPDATALARSLSGGG